MNQESFETTNLSAEAWDAPVPFESNLAASGIPVSFDLLPKTIADMCREVSRTTRLPDAMIFGCALGVLSAAAGKACAAQIKSGHGVSTALFVLCVAESGGGKTPIANPLKEPLDTYARNKKPEYDDAFAQYRANRIQWEATEKRFRKRLEQPAKNGSAEAEAESVANGMSLKELMAAEPQPPMPFNMYATDATSEALMRDMQERNGVYSIVSSESRQFLDIALGKYNQQGDVQAVLSGIAGDTIISSRKGSATVTIEKPYLSALTFTQPDKLQEMGNAPHLRDSGYLQRILFFSGTPDYPYYSEDKIPDVIKAAYDACILAICEQRMDEGTYCFSDAERSLWIGFHDKIKDRQRQSIHREPFLNGWLQKQPENVARIAMLYYLADGGKTPMLDCLSRAIASMEQIIIPHFEYALGIIGENPQMVQARKAWGWIERNHETLTGRHGEPIVKNADLQQSGTAGIGTAEEAAVVLSSLAGMNYLRREIRKNRGAKESTVFKIRPM